MTTPQIQAARKANRATLDAYIHTLKPPVGAVNQPLRRAASLTPTLISPTERAALIAKEAAKPAPSGCCGP